MNEGMRNRDRKLPQRNKERGALLILTLLILLVVSMLGMAAIDSTGLEMKMASNSRLQQEAFEAAEYTLSWVENDMATTGYFSTTSITNAAGCGNVCFVPNTCTKGYCFYGTDAGTYDTCTTTVAEPFTDSTIWSTATKHKTLSIPNSDITAKYIIEFWCYIAKNKTAEMTSAATSARVYRITAYAVGEGGKARAMLRSTIREN
jgi:type IV pilus assembly protein PilX